MNILRKIVLGNLLGIFALMGTVGFSPARAQSSSDSVKSAVQEVQRAQSGKDRDARGHGDFLLRAVDALKVRHVSNRGKISDTEVRRLIDRNDGLLKSLEARIRAAREKGDREELKKIELEFRNHRKKEDREERAKAIEHFVKKLTSAIERAENRVNKLDEVLARYTASGKNVDDLRRQLGDARDRLKTAREDLRSVLASIQPSAGDIRIEAVKASFDKVATVVKGVYKTLEDIVNQLRAMGPLDNSNPASETVNP